VDVDEREEREREGERERERERERGRETHLDFARGFAIALHETSINNIDVIHKLSHCYIGQARRLERE